VEIGDVNSHLEVIKDDDLLRHFEKDIKLRIEEFTKWLQIFEDSEGGLVKIGRSYENYGLKL